jgi:hypothetical protein
MSDLEATAEKDLPFFKEMCQQLYELVDQMVPKELILNGDDFGFMALCFIGKQLEHMKSVLTLGKEGLYRDAALIVRSMIEGHAQLAYADNDPKRLGRMWREFSAVTSWRKLQIHLRMGRPVDPKSRQNVEAIMQKSGVQFQSKTARIRDGYWTNWANLSYSRMIRDMGADIIADLVYGPFSEWHHWSPEGVGAALQVDPDSTYFSAPSEVEGAMCFANAFQWLFQMAFIVNDHFKLGSENALNTLRDAYLKRPSQVGSSSTSGP